MTNFVVGDGFSILASFAGHKKQDSANQLNPVLFSGLVSVFKKREKMTAYCALSAIVAKS